jgi:hypothetical protein
MREIWKPICGYEGIYEVSNCGNVRSIDRIDFAGRRLKGKLFSTNAKEGYITVRLSKNGNIKTFKIHQLVAEAFVPNPENKPCVNHKDGNKQNNHVENLEWCTHSENNIHAFKTGLSTPKRKLDDESIKLILDSKGKVSCNVLAKIHGVSFQMICKIWKAGGRPCRFRTVALNALTSVHGSTKCVIWKS